MKKQSLLKGALVLTLASLITRVLVLANSMVQARVLSSEGIGLKMMVMPLMGLMLTLTTVGLPLAISRQVAEADAQRNGTKVKKILIVSLTITGSLSIVVSAAAILAGSSFSAWFLSDRRSYYAFMALIPIIPVIAVSSVLKGYFRGMQAMTPIAMSQVLEQIVRLSTTYFLVQWLLPYGIEYAAAGAVLSTVIGEVFSLAYLLIVFKLSHRRKIYLPDSLWKKVAKGKAILFDLMQTALPSLGSGLIRSFTKAVQPVIITKSLAMAGFSSALIARDYGMLTGYVMPLLFFPGFVNQSLGVSLVPAISEASAQDNLRLARRRIFQAIFAALGVGVPSTLLLYLFAPELMSAIYKSPQAAPLLKFIAPFYLLHYLEAPLQSALVGLGRAKTAMVNNMVGKGVTLISIYPLAAHFTLGIYGVMAALSLGVISETLLHVFSVGKLIGFSLENPEEIISAYFKVLRRDRIEKIPLLGRMLVLLFPLRR